MSRADTAFLPTSLNVRPIRSFFLEMVFNTQQILCAQHPFNPQGWRENGKSNRGKKKEFAHLWWVGCGDLWSL